MDFHTNSLKLNVVMNALLKLSSIVFPLITFPYVSRILLPEGIGKVAFATSFVSYFSLFAQLGIPNYGIRACAKVRDDKQELSRTAQELLIINLFMCVFVYIVFIIAITTIPSLRQEKTLYLVMSITIFLNSLGMEWLYKALEQYTYITIRSVIFKFIALVAMFIFIKEKDDYVVYGALSIFASSASNILNFFHVHKYVKVKPVGGYHFLRHMKAVLIFFAMSCATSIYTHIDATMLGIMVGDAEVGIYDAAVKIRTALLGLVTSLGTVLLPRSSYYIEKNMLFEFKKITQKAMQFICILSASLMVFFIIFAKESIFLLSGEAFSGSIIPLRIILPTVLLVGITNITGIQMLVPLGKEKYVLYSEIAGGVTDLILNAVLIPAFGAPGAAIGTLAAEAVVLLMQYFPIKRFSRSVFASVSYGKLLIALISAGLASFWVKYLGISYFFILLIAAILFFGSVGIILLLLKEPVICEVVDQFFAIFRKYINK